MSKRFAPSLLGGRTVVGIWLAMVFAPVLILTSLTVMAGAGLGGSATCSAPRPRDAASSAALASNGRVEGTFVPFDLYSESGERVQLAERQLGNARLMLEAAQAVSANEQAIIIMLAATLQESRLRNLANPDMVPESLNAVHDGEGSDHDSVGVLQQRPSAGWGSPAQLMDPAFAARAFLGGPTGPNRGSPAGLLDIPDWDELPLGDAAQRVQGSAHPELYDQWIAPALVLFEHLGGTAIGCALAATGEGAYPLAAPAVITDGVGPRPCRVQSAGGCAASTWHPALDFGAACGEPVLAARGGVVSTVSGYWVGITADDGTVVSYLHMYPSDVLVNIGDHVGAGDRIGSVGSAGPSTGCHLDFRVNVIASTDAAVAALEHVGIGSVEPGYVDPVAYMALYGVDLEVGERA